jgi:hypothetical protein
MKTFTMVVGVRDTEVTHFDCLVIELPKLQSDVIKYNGKSLEDVTHHTLNDVQYLSATLCEQ